MGRGCGAIVAAVLACVCWAGVAHSEEKSKEQKAVELVVRGVELYKKEFWLEAIKHFKKANELIFDPSNLYNIARCYDNLGSFREAAIYYQRYIVKGGKNAKKASNYLESIKLMPGTMIVTSTPVGADVYIDGSSHSAGKTPLEIDIKPGNHELVIKKPGFANQMKVAMIGFAEVKEFEFTLWTLKGTGETSSEAELDESYQVWVETPTSMEEGQEEAGLSMPPGSQKQPARTSHLVATAAGFSFPLQFREVNSFVGWSLLWQAMKEVGGGGIGMDMQFGGNVQIYNFFAHGILGWEHRSGFSLFARLGVGIGVLRCYRQGMDLCKDVVGGMLLRFSLGLGWSHKWFDIRLDVANFMVYVWGSYFTKTTAQYMPLLWVGYRF